MHRPCPSVGRYNRRAAALHCDCAEDAESLVAPLQRDEIDSGSRSRRMKGAVGGRAERQAVARLHDMDDTALRKLQAAFYQPYLLADEGVRRRRQAYLCAG